MATSTEDDVVDRQQLVHALTALLANTETMTEGAARRGISLQTMRRRVQAGEIEYIAFGRDIRIWRAQ